MIATAVALITVVLVLYPFFVDRRNPELERMLVTAGDQTQQDLERDRIFTMLGELEYDYRMDKVTEADYRELRADLTSQAAKLVKSASPGSRGKKKAVGGERKLSEEEIAKQLEAEVERIVARITGEKETTGRPATEAARSGGRPAVFCPECGARLVKENQKFCHACGVALNWEELASHDA